MNNENPKLIPLSGNAAYVDDGKPVKPLSNSVIDFIFRDEQTGGKVMHGLANAILEDSGDKTISSVISIQPQRYQYGSGGRWYRLDVLAKTEDNEIVLLEVQVDEQPNFNTRSMLYAMEPLQSKVKKGDDWTTIEINMPRVISINLLEFELRESGRNFHQVIEPVYREEPHEVAEHHHITHNIELPKFRRIEPDFSNPLHLWLTAICRSQDEGKTVREVVDMEPKLKEFETEDQSFCQYVMNYDFANIDEETRRLHSREILDIALERQSILMRIEEGREEGREEGHKEGRKETAKRLLLEGLPVELIARASLMNVDEVKKLQKDTTFVSEAAPEYNKSGAVTPNPVCEDLT